MIEFYDTDPEGNLIDRRVSTPEERAEARADLGWPDTVDPWHGYTFRPNLRMVVDGQVVEPISEEDNPDLGAGFWIYPDGTPHYADGTEVAPIDKLPGDNEEPYDKWERWKRNENIRGAKAVIEGFLKRFGLGALTEIAMGWAESGMSYEAMLVELRYGDDPVVRQVYDGKFPAMALREAAGLRAINEAEYLDLERGILQIASRAGIDSQFLGMDADTGQTGVTALIAGDVSLSEWRDRVALAEEAKNSADAETIEVLQSRYNFTDGDVVSAMLNPEKTKNIIDARRQFGAAGLTAQAQQTLGPQQTFSQELSEDLQRMNVQRREVASRLSPLRGLTTDLVFDTGLTGDELAEGAFGTTDDAAIVRRKQQERGASFMGDTGLLTTREGVTGFGSA